MSSPELHEYALLVSRPVVHSSQRTRSNRFLGIVLWVGLLAAVMNPSAQAQTWLSATASSTTAGNATVTWSTAVPSDSQVEYGTTAAYGNVSALVSTKVMAHSVGLSGMTPGTTYHFRVRSSDASGVLVIGADNTLATAAAATITLAPLTATLAAGGTQQFTASVSGAVNTAVSWSATAGTVSAAGLFTALSLSAATTVTVTATSQADATKKASATLQITATQGSGTMLLGDRSIESMVNGLPSGMAESYQMTAATSGTLNSLSAYVDASTSATNLLVGMYSDSNGHPDTLLTSGSTTQFKKATWNTIPVPPIAITAGAKYWFSLLGTGGYMKFRQKQGSGGWINELNSVSGLASLPSRWTSGTVYPSGALTSVYGSGIAGAVTSTPPPVTAPVLAINTTSLNFAAQAGASSVAPAALSITNTGTGTLSFTGTSDQTWLGLSPASGTTPATLAVSPSTTGLKAGTYTGHVTLTGGGTTKTVTVVLTITSIPVQHSVALAWKAGTNSHVVSYSLYRSTISGSSYALAASAIGGVTYNDQSVQPATTYYYVVTAVDDQGRESGYSGESRATIP